MGPDAPGLMKDDGIVMAGKSGPMELDEVEAAESKAGAMKGGAMKGGGG